MDASVALKRFYKQVKVEDGDVGFRITLDGRDLKTPAKRKLRIPTESLAIALAQEWDNQEKHIDAMTMPMMGLVSTAIDRIGQMRDGVVDQIAKYGETDLICYRTDEDPLAERQNKAWTPFIGWAKDKFDIEFNVSTSIMHVAQPPETLENIYEAVNVFNDWELAALSSATHCTGSVVIALALMDGFVDESLAFEASQVDETYQIELWGEDFEAKDRRDAIQRDLKSIIIYLDHLKS